MIFDRQGLMESAGREIAPGSPAGFSESFGSALELSSKTMLSISAENALSEAYGDYISEIHSFTGKRLFNPMNFGVKERAKMETRFAEEVEKLREENPEVPHVSPKITRAAIAEDRSALRERAASVSRRGTGIPASLGGFLGTAAAVLADPPVLASMAFGAPMATGILRGALIDAGINVGVEVGVQAAVQSERREFGERPSLSEASQAVLAAGAGGFLLSGLVRGGVKAARPARGLLQKARGLKRKSAEVKDAEAYILRREDMLDESPFEDSPLGRAEHSTRFDDAFTAIREGRVSFQGRPRSPVRDVAEPSAEGAPEVVREIGRALHENAKLSARSRAAVEAAEKVARDPEAFAAFVRDVKTPPKVESPRLATFLQRQGGIREEAGELAAIGITPRSRPGLVRKQGVDLDTAGERAFEAGFFPERPSVAQLLDALRDDVQGRPVFADAADQVVAEDVTRLAEFSDALADAGVDLHALPTAEARQAVLRAGTELRARNAAQAHADAESALHMPPDDTAPVDAAIEADVRRIYAERGGDEILIEGEGGFERMTADEMFDSFERDAADLDALRVCVGGGR